MMLTTFDAILPDGSVYQILCDLNQADYLAKIT